MLKEDYFFVGVAGAGMSALAQFLAGRGKGSAGSDRQFGDESLAVGSNRFSAVKSSGASQGEGAKVKRQLEEAGVKCFPQNGSGINSDLTAVVVSTAIEAGNPDIERARELGVPIMHRSELLAKIILENPTIAVSGTSGKSTASGLIWHILNFASRNYAQDNSSCNSDSASNVNPHGDLNRGPNSKILPPSLLSGAGLTVLEEQGKIGNAVAGKVGVDGASGYLVVEADESDGTLVRYSPKIGVILNVDKDHKELSELKEIFNKFAKNVDERGGFLIVNEKVKNDIANFSCADKQNGLGKTNAEMISGKESACLANVTDGASKAKGMSAANGARMANLANVKNEENGRMIFFGWDDGCDLIGKDFFANGFGSEFTVEFAGKKVGFSMPAPGKYNAENALSAIAVCALVGVSLETCAEALKTWKGIHRRSQIYPLKNGVVLVDDYAHNPAKIAASIRSCQDFAKGKVFAWFQPHGFGPTKFLKDDLVEEISKTLRKGKAAGESGDSMWFSSIYYAGGTADRTFDSDILSNGLIEMGCEAHFIANRDECLKTIMRQAKSGDVVLLMGARDPSLGEFANRIVKDFGCYAG